MHLLTKLYLERNGIFVLGPGRVKLLRSIDALGSLQKAALELGMSYRWAWGRLKDTEQALGVSLLSQDAGATRSKGKTLTKEARELLAWIESIENKLDDALRDGFADRPGFLDSVRPPVPRAENDNKTTLD